MSAKQSTLAESIDQSVAVERKPREPTPELSRDEYLVDVGAGDKEVLKLRACPVCDQLFTGTPHRERHLIEHGPEHFGLSPLRGDVE